MGPGGSAYYGALRPDTISSNLPEFLKQKLKARGILKDEPAKDNIVASDNRLTNQARQSPAIMATSTLPSEWVLLFHSLVFTNSESEFFRQ
ncbi:WW domain-containing protein [Artemisia annua]|uniref:WW domain-containing protein n=1 Tax=Artemisia annua TaxID=35608 RepID=A0A2U1PIM7_ARTAN|nr:WW domain-containing protein [Artemisia annua]